MNTRNTATLHGNFMVVDQLGVAITGAPGSGKSELALALLERGHRFVSDDAVDLYCDGNKVMGRCPNVSAKFMLIAGIGVINIAKLFGNTAFVPEYELQLIIQLVNPEEMPTHADPLHPLLKSIKIRDVTIPKIVFPASTARRLPLLIETLIRNYRLKLDGYDAGVEFTKRQRFASGTAYD